MAHISSNRQDIKTFVSMAKHMVLFLSVESPSTWGVGEAHLSYQIISGRLVLIEIL